MHRHQRCILGRGAQHDGECYIALVDGAGETSNIRVELVCEDGVHCCTIVSILPSQSGDILNGNMHPDMPALLSKWE